MRLAEVKKGYTRAARFYDGMLKFGLGAVLHVERHRRRAIRLMGLKEGDTVLDMGCGTGVNFPHLMKEVGEKGAIIGFDYTDAMLAQARKRIEKHNWKNVTLQKGDAVHIKLKHKVDAVISTYCFSLLYDPELTFENALKTLKRGGRITILDIGKPKNPVGRLLYWAYSCIVLKCGIASDEDLESRWLPALQDMTKKEFLFGMVVLYSGSGSASF